MTRPSLTIGTPVYQDPTGLQMLLQSLALYFPLGGVELIVIDNAPRTEQRGGKTVPTKDTADLISYCRNMGVKYVPLAEPVGTAPPRNEIFKHASHDVVIICDAHIMLQAGSLDRIVDYFSVPEHALDIATGPLFARKRQPSGRLEVSASAYADRWRGGMWGTWMKAIRCACREYHVEVDVAVPETPADSGLQIVNGTIIASASTGRKPPMCEFYGAVMGRPKLTHCPACGREFPVDLQYHGHMDALRKEGFLPRCWDEDDVEPFEIPGLGLGFFACRREAWVGFPPELSGFGGGELHLHEAFRRAGGKAVNIPQAGWFHRFVRPEGKPPYPLELWKTVRNAVIWRNRLSMDLEPIREHYVDHKDPKRNRLTAAQWDLLVADPVAYAGAVPEAEPAPVAPKQVVSIEVDPLESIFQRQCRTRCDIEKHLPTVKKLAEQVTRVVCLSKRPAWDAGIVAARPGEYVHFCTHSPTKLQQQLQAIYPYTYRTTPLEPIDCDLLVVDTIHTGKHFAAELDRWAPHVGRWIVRRATGTFGEKGEKRDGGGHGLNWAIERLCEPGEWRPVFHSGEQGGLTVISRDPNERTIWRGVGWEFTKLNKSIGVNPAPNCTCKQLAIEMNQIGPAGCRERFDEFLAKLHDNAKRYDWNAKIQAGWGSIKSGLAFEILFKKPTDPVASMFEIAIERAEAEEREWLSRSVRFDNADEALAVSRELGINTHWTEEGRGDE